MLLTAKVIIIVTIALVVLMLGLAVLGFVQTLLLYSVGQIFVGFLYLIAWTVNAIVWTILYPFDKLYLYFTGRSRAPQSTITPLTDQYPKKYGHLVLVKSTTSADAAS